jgi:hypothetical protein
MPVQGLPGEVGWVRHLSTAEVREFVLDLVNAVRDATELDVHSNLHRVTVEWRATARILADPEPTAVPPPKASLRPYWRRVKGREVVAERLEMWAMTRRSATARSISAGTSSRNRTTRVVSSIC